MNIPNYLNSPIADKDGNLTPEWSNLMSQLITQLQLNLSNEGYRIPQLSAADIAKLTDVQKSKGNIVYNIDSNEFEGNRNGVWGVL